MGYEIDVLVDSQHDVLAVFTGQCWQVDMATRHIDTLMRTQNTVIGDLSDNRWSINAYYHHIQGAIIEKNMIAFLNISSKIGIGKIDNVVS